MSAFHVCALRHVLLHGRDTDKIWCESRVTEVDVDGDPEKVKVLLWGLCNGGGEEWRVERPIGKWRAYIPYITQIQRREYSALIPENCPAPQRGRQKLLVNVHGAVRQRQCLGAGRGNGKGQLNRPLVFDVLVFNVVRGYGPQQHQISKDLDGIFPMARRSTIWSSSLRIEVSFKRK